ncbi:MAG: ABC transporter substrate-binding protein [Planctomycetota bacterium]|jgi:ABC-type transport system substrate-binding protein
MLGNLIKINLLFFAVILLAVHVWQINAVEERVLNLEAEVQETGAALEEQIEAAQSELRQVRGELDQVEGAVQRTERHVVDLAARGVRVATQPGTPAAAPPAEREPTEQVDPRTLPYWPTDDNILVDLDREPRPPADAPKGGVIKYFVRSNPRSLNTHIWNDAELQEQIAAPVYEYLADRSRHNPDEYVPGLCNRVTVNDDYTVFTCYVRKGMYWHKPYLTQPQKRGDLAWLDKLPLQEVTAYDVKFNFDVVRDPLSECGPIASYFVDLDTVEVLDRYTVRFTWKKPSYFNKNSTLHEFFIYPKFIYERDRKGQLISPEEIAPRYPQHWFNHMMCGTGPFRFAGFEPNQLVRLRRNDAHWSPVKPVIDGMDLRIASDATIRLNLFKAGELDMLFLTPAQYRAEILENGSLRKGIDNGKYFAKKWEMFTYYFIAWNLRHKILRDRKVRRALAHLYPKKTIIRDIHYGLATAHDSPVHKFENAYAKDLEKFPYDPEEAARLLDAAGWEMGPQGVREKVIEGEKLPLKFKFLYATTSTTARDMALLFEQSAKKVGVLIVPDAQLWEALTQLLDDKQFDSVTLGWGNSWDSNPSQIWHPDSAKSAKGSNFVSYMNPRIAEIIEGLKVEFTLDKRRALWRDFQHTIVGDQPYIFDTISTRYYVVNSRLANPYLCKIRPQVWFLPWVVKGE